MTRRFLLTCAALMLLVLAPESGGATLDCKCVTVTMQPDDHHLFSSGGTLAYKCDQPGCHTEAVSNYCSSEHEGCGISAIDGRQFERDLSLESAARLAVYDNVLYNPQRHALQALDCNGRVVASVRAPEQFAALWTQIVLLKYA